jgi:cysteinyl-tRNA synthetase
MPLVVYNTLTRRKEPFEPRQAGRVGMYVCGLTVYDYAHIGHARTAVAFETIRRWFAHSGYHVTFVQNVTDVDDKIINRARELGVEPQAHAAKWTDICNDHMARLGVSPPDVQPKVTTHMPEIVALIERLVARGAAYVAADGSVYYAVESKADYGKLSNRTPEELLAGARVEPAEGKRDPKDFALWKASKPDEPAWDSPWGKGRPGWHIECSAMSMKYLGEQFDVHGGGVDLVFPHHENEIAQSEGASGQTPFVRYWLHTGFLTVNGEKMSKSLKNYVTIEDVLKAHDPEVIRFFYANTHYRSGIDYTAAGLDEAKRGLERLRRLRDELRRAAGNGAGSTGGDAALAEATAALSTRFTEGMDDDFNTRAAVAALFDFVTAANKALTDGVGAASARSALETFASLARVLTIFPEERTLEPEFVERVQALVRERDAARARKDYAASDALRAQLVEMGVEISDSKDGTKWRLAR